MRQSNRTFADFVEDATTFLALSELKPDARSDKMLPDANLTLNTWDGARVLARSPLLRDEEFLFADATVRSLSETLDVSTLTFGEPADPDDEGVRYQLHRIRKAKPKKLRGIGSLASPIVVEMLQGWVAHDGTYCSARFYAARNGKNWDLMKMGRNASEHSYRCMMDRWDKLTNMVQLMLAVQFDNEYRWRVAVGYEGCPAITFTTDPTGAAAVFRLRDLPEGRSRRAALRHWVSEHWRQNREDPDEEIRVKEHLRGAEWFHWNGLRCKITPSLDSLKRAAAPRPEPIRRVREHASV